MKPMTAKQKLEVKEARQSIEIHDMMVAMQDELERQNEGSAADINLVRVVEMVHEVRRMQRALELTLLELEACED